MKKAIAVLLSVSMIIGMICAAGSFSVSAEEENEAVFSVVGSSTAIFGTAYNLNDESTVMTYDPDDGLYKYTFTDVQPEKNVTFAVVMNHKWYDVYPVFNEETIVSLILYIFYE